MEMLQQTGALILGLALLGYLTYALSSSGSRGSRMTIPPPPPRAEAWKKAKKRIKRKTLNKLSELVEEEFSDEVIVGNVTSEKMAYINGRREMRDELLELIRIEKSKL